MSFFPLFWKLFFIPDLFKQWVKYFYCGFNISFQSFWGDVIGRLRETIQEEAAETEELLEGQGQRVDGRLAPAQLEGRGGRAVPPP